MLLFLGLQPAVFGVSEREFDQNVEGRGSNGLFTACRRKKKATAIRLCFLPKHSVRLCCTQYKVLQRACTPTAVLQPPPFAVVLLMQRPQLMHNSTVVLLLGCTAHTDNSHGPSLMTTGDNNHGSCDHMHGRRQVLQLYRRF